MKLKLIKGRSYSYGKIKVTNDKPIFETADNKLADALIKSGFFVAVSEPAPVKNNNTSGNKDKEPKETPLEKMTAKQLDAYAKEKGIDLKGLKTNADKIAKIKELLQAADDKPGEVDFDEEV